jgi:hypothetical protein
MNRVKDGKTRMRKEDNGDEITLHRSGPNETGSIDKDIELEEHF